MTATQQPPASQQPGQQLPGQPTVAQHVLTMPPVGPHQQSPGRRATQGKPRNRRSLRSSDTRVTGTPAILRSLLTGLVAAAATPSGQGATAVASALRDARSWYVVTTKVFKLNLAANYAREAQLVIGAKASWSAAKFARLEADLNRAIAADQVTFRSSATSGSDAFGGLEIGVILAALVIAGASAWGLSRRLAEYR